MTDRVPRAVQTALRTPFLAAAVLAAAGFASLAGSPLASAGPVTTAHSCKPLPPVEVQLMPLDGTAPDGVGRFRVDVTPQMPAREVRVRWFRSSNRLTWVSGDSLASQSGLLAPHRFQVALRVPATGLETLHCQVEVITESGQVWRRGVGVALGPESLRARGRMSPDGEGGHFVEFDAAPADQRGEDPR